MRISTFSLILIPVMSLASDAFASSDIPLESLKEEIRLAELAFCKLATESGLQVAFTSFAAEDAVIKRGDQLIKGREAIHAFYSESSPSGVSLEWSPDFIDVSPDGSLGYTYGRFTYSRTGEDGESKSSTGIFHTVWKRQPDGSWKYVWD